MDCLCLVRAAAMAKGFCERSLLKFKGSRRHHDRLRMCLVTSRPVCTLCQSISWLWLNGRERSLGLRHRRFYLSSFLFYHFIQVKCTRHGHQREREREIEREREWLCIRFDSKNITHFACREKRWREIETWLGRKFQECKWQIKNTLILLKY